MSCTPEQSGSLADWVGALATAGAVVIALFRETFWAWWQRPLLSIEAAARPPDCHKTQMGTWPDLRPVYYLRLLVRNKGKTRAVGVQVHADRLYRRDRARQFYEDTDFLPMYLGAGGTVIEGIPPGMSRNIDLGHLEHPNQQHPKGFPEEKTWLTLNVEFQAYKGTHFLTPGDYRLDVTVAADNADPAKFTVQLAFSGDWDDDEGTMLGREVSLSLA